MHIKHLILLLDDVSEIDGDALKLFIDTVVSPLNNWPEEFIKFKIAFYPSRIHYGKIDPGKIDIINMDEIYELIFRVSMNVPRIMGYVLAYLHESVIIYDKKIRRSDIENAAERYYDERSNAFFKASTYCLLSIEESSDFF